MYDVVLHRLNRIALVVAALAIVCLAGINMHANRYKIAKRSHISGSRALGARARANMYVSAASQQAL